LLWMFVASTVGSLAGLLWPICIVLWRRQTSSVYHMGGERASKVFKALQLALLALVIAIVAAAVGFFGFIGTDAQQRELQDLGGRAFFAAFTYGFSAGSFVAAPLSSKPQDQSS
jgi:hypothetical protein